KNEKHSPNHENRATRGHAEATEHDHEHPNRTNHGREIQQPINITHHRAANEDDTDDNNNDSSSHNEPATELQGHDGLSPEFQLTLSWLLADPHSEFDRDNPKPQMDEPANHPTPTV